MPLVRIAYRSGKGPGFGRAVGESVHRAMVETIDVPAKDVFQIITEHGIVLVQITLNAGRSLELKQALYARIAERLGESPGVRREDVFVSLVEVPKENWSFGNGLAQYT